LRRAEHQELSAKLAYLASDSYKQFYNKFKKSQNKGNAKTIIGPTESTYLILQTLN
jgi:hypothetical protein